MIVIMRGIPGAGKTTWAKKNYPDSLTVSADDFFTEDGKYVYDAHRAAEAHGWALRCFIDLARLNRLQTIVVDNTNIFATDVAPYVAVGRAYGHEHRIVTLICDPKAAQERNVHGVSLERTYRLEEWMHREHLRLPSFWVQETHQTSPTSP